MRTASRLAFSTIAGVLLVIDVSTAVGQGPSDGAYLAVPAAVPLATVRVNTSTYNVPISGGKVMTISHSNSFPPYTTYSIFAVGNRDPYIDYLLSVTNTSSSDLFFQFAFGIPIVLSGDNSALRSDLSINLLDDGDNSVNLFPTYDGINPATGIQRALLSTDGGTTFDSLHEFGPLGSLITTPGMSDYQFSQAATNAAAMVNFDYLELLVGFNLSPGDSVELHGNIAIAVPEPSTLSLACVSGMAFLLFRWRSRRETSKKHYEESAV